MRAARRSPPGSLALGLEVALLIVLAVTIAVGMGLLIGRARPASPLHYVLAVAALGVPPIAEVVSRGSSPRARGLASLVGALVALAVVASLFATG